MARSMMDDIFTACETMSLEELDKLYCKVGNTIDKKRADRKIELLANLTKAYRELRAEYPIERAYVQVGCMCGECNWADEIDVNIYELMDKYFGEG